MASPILLQNTYAQDIYRGIAKSEFTQAIVDSVNARSLKTQESAVQDGKRPVWRTPEDQARFAQYKLYADLFKTQHEKHLRPGWLPSGKTEYRTLNFLKYASLVYRSLMLGGGVEITTGRQEIDDYLNNKLKLSRYLRQWVLAISIYGFKAVQVIEKQDGVDFVEHDPDIIFPCFKQGSDTELEYVSKKVYLDPERDVHVPPDSAWQFDGKTMDGVIFEERHFKGAIQYYLYAVQGNEIVQFLPVQWYLAWLPAYEEFEGRTVSRTKTNIDEFMLIVIPNFVFEKEFYSDYHDVWRIQGEINTRSTQIGRILNIHGDPKLMLPESFQQKDPYTGMSIARGIRDELLFITPEDAYFPPQYLTWDAQLDQAYKDIDNLVNAFCTLTQISPTLLVRDDSSFPESAISYKMRLTPTLNRVAEKCETFSEGVRKFLYVYIQKLLQKGYFLMSNLPEDVTHDVSATDPGEDPTTLMESKTDNAFIDQNTITLRFKPSLPQDERFLVDRVGGPSASLKRVLMDLDDMSEEEAEEEMQLIRQDGLEGTGGRGPAGPDAGGFFGSPESERDSQLNPTQTGLQSTAIATTP